MHCNSSKAQISPNTKNPIKSLNEVLSESKVLKMLKNTQKYWL